jgi:hypothetical protein
MRNDTRTPLYGEIELWFLAYLRNRIEKSKGNLARVLLSKKALEEVLEQKKQKR